MVKLQIRTLRPWGQLAASSRLSSGKQGCEESELGPREGKWKRLETLGQRRVIPLGLLRGLPPWVGSTQPSGAQSKLPAAITDCWEGASLTPLCSSCLGPSLYQFLFCVIFITLVYLWGPRREVIFQAW